MDFKSTMKPEFVYDNSIEIQKDLATKVLAKFCYQANPFLGNVRYYLQPYNCT